MNEVTNYYTQNTNKDGKQKKQKIKNPHYLRFLKEGSIDLLTLNQIERACDNIQKCERKNIVGQKVYLLLLYYTGARPNEIMRLKTNDFVKNGNYLTIKLPSSKNGLPRPFMMNFKSTKYTTYIYNYITSLFPDTYVFHFLWSEYRKTRTNKKGVTKVYMIITDNLRYKFKKWFDGVIEFGIPPYFLRHNRFSNLAMKDTKLETLRLLKGAKTFNSIIPYLHMSTHESKKITSKLD